MSSRRKLAIGAIAVSTVIAVSGLFALRMLTVTTPEAAVLNVPGAFKTIRDSPGHIAHVRIAKIQCTNCHDLDQHGFQIPAEDLCARCHNRESDHRVAAIHANSPLGAAAVDCQSCHTFVIDPGIRAENCLRCHDREQGGVVPIVTHSEADCTQCHSPHQVPSLIPRPCAECHEDRAEVKHGGRAVGAMLCLDCHGVHDQKAEADRRCTTCHKPIAATAIFPGHDACVSCHAPHEFTAATAKPCASCHENQKALASKTVAKHQRCESCHKNHKQKAPTEAACLDCHRKVKLQGHPPDASGASCLGCHPAHPTGGGAVAAVVGCPTCHQTAATMTSFHSEKTACVDCHRPHGFAVRKEDASFCGSCHKDQLRLTRRAKKNGHANCVNCHQQAPHQPKDPAKACVTCHEPVRDTAPKDHQNCVTCHVPHSGEMVKDVTCGSCHKPQKESKHGSVQGGCMSCHRPHGPGGRAQTPKCETCHEPGRMPGLHALEDHRSCASCHKAHDGKSTRATCAASGCHLQVKGAPVGKHEPTAKVCTGCHLFGNVRGGN